MNKFTTYLKSRLCIASAGILLATAQSVSAQQLPEKKFSHPERIKYDNQCFTIEGEDIFVFSAAFHYFRCPQELWRDRFAKIKEAGFNTVETYVPWNWHERNMPKNVNDYSQCDFTDLKAWLKMAHEEFDLYTIVRPGPFICAEWAGGAYPRWLAKFCPDQYDTSFWLRSNHPEHIKWSTHWFNAVSPVFADEQLSRKKKGEKGIIMVQLENEYIYFGMESDKKIEFLKALYDASVKNGIDVPLFTCVTPEVRGSKDPVISQLFDMDNQYVWWNMHEAKTRIEDLRKIQPNAPAFVCELQGGWFSTVGGGLSEDSYLDGRHASGMALMGMAGGSTGLNYYMFFGGTHFAGWGARRMTTTYDYGAPLKENGGVGEKYAAVKSIGNLINKYEQQLTRTTDVSSQLSGATEDMTAALRQSADQTRFLFVLNKNKKQPVYQTLTVQTANGKTIPVTCSLKPLESKLLVLPSGATSSMDGEWFPQEAEMPKRPTSLPAAIRISKAWKQNEDYNGNWQKLRNGVSLPELDVNDCRYSMYKSDVNVSKKELQQYGTLLFDMFTDDPMYVEVNGQVAAKASTDENDNTFDVQGLLKEGKNTIVALYENKGHAHGYRPMEELSGMRKGGLGKPQTSISPIEDWDVKAITTPVKDIASVTSASDGWDKILLNEETIAGLATLQIAGLEKPKWPAAWVIHGKEGTAVYRTHINFTPDMLANEKTVLEFACIDDEGTLFVNGKEVGTHNEWDKPFIVNIAPYIKPGNNEVAVMVKNGSGAGGILKSVRLLRELKIEKPLNWMVSTDLGGVVNNWHMPTNPTSGWAEVSLNTQDPIARKGKNVQPKGEQDGLLTWYKVEFDMPTLPSNVWIPWRAIINASGTGYMWLNGNNIGRHWEEGPQREFYLPECWLNFGGKNTLVFALRQSASLGALLNAVEIAPYENDAEMRTSLSQTNK